MRGRGQFFFWIFTSNRLLRYNLELVSIDYELQKSASWRPVHNSTHKLLPPFGPFEFCQKMIAKGTVAGPSSVHSKGKRPQTPEERRFLPSLLWTTAQLVGTVGVSGVLSVVVVTYRNVVERGDIGKKGCFLVGFNALLVATCFLMISGFGWLVGNPFLGVRFLFIPSSAGSGWKWLGWSITECTQDGCFSTFHLPYVK